MMAERDISDSNAYIIGFGLSLSGRRQVVINNEDFVKIVEKVKTQKRKTELGKKKWWAICCTWCCTLYFKAYTTIQGKLFCKDTIREYKVYILGCASLNTLIRYLYEKNKHNCSACISFVI